MHAAIHLPTPGSPAYALAKLGAIGGVVALKVALSRRAKRPAEPEADAEPSADRPSRPHPVSRRKANRRGRKRR
jgi:hypothetical protein